MSSGESTELSVAGRRDVSRGLRLTLQEVEVVNSRGQRFPVDFLAFRRPGVAVLCTASDGDVVLIRRWRLGTGRSGYEVPMGAIEHDDIDEEAAAVRELREELGLVRESLAWLGDIFPVAGMGDLRLSVWHTELAPGEQLSPDPLEASEAVLVSGEQLFDLASSGQMVDGVTLAAYGLGRLNTVFSSDGAS